MARLVLATPEDPHADADARRYAVRLLAELSARRHEATLLPLPLGDGAVRGLNSAPEAAMLLADGVLLGSLSPDAIAALGRPFAALVDCPASLDPALAPQDARRIEHAERAAFTAASVVVATGAATRTLLIERFGVPKARMRVAEPGVDPAPRARGGGEDAPVILTVGTISPRKNQIALARALGRVMDLGWRWRIAGRRDAFPAYAAELETAIAEEGISDRVEFLGDSGETALADAYDRADLFALISRLEGYGASYAEALARGLPVLAGAGEAAAGLVPAAAGGLAPPDDPATVAVMLHGLLSDTDARARAARASRSAGTRLPRWFQCADVMEHLMEQAAG